MKTLGEGGVEFSDRRSIKTGPWQGAGFPMELIVWWSASCVGGGEERDGGGAAAVTVTAAVTAAAARPYEKPRLEARGVIYTQHVAGGIPTWGNPRRGVYAVAAGSKRQRGTTGPRPDAAQWGKIQWLRIEKIF